MYGLIDCNNFFASCERVFNPSLRNQPIVVLSNNDGCIIARSDEAKAIGIPMGAPVFQMRDIIKANNVHVFSSNYILYGDMSNRVMSILAGMVPEIEVYSIDEAFLHLDGFSELYNLNDFAKHLVKYVGKATGIPVSLGIAETKTLSKLANHYAKKNKLLTKGLYVLDTEEKITTLLKATEIGDVWGIGRRYSKFLMQKGIMTAYDFTKASAVWVRKEMSVVGLRTWKELRGEPCIELDHTPSAKKSICTSRSFRSKLTKLPEIEQAMTYYASACARKLRAQDSCARVMTVILYTDYFRKDLPQYTPSLTMQLSVASNDSMELTKYAIEGLRKIFKSGYSYKKAGVIVSEIVPQSHVQGNLFDTIDRSKRARLMNAIDHINDEHGRDKIRLASFGFDRHWVNRRDQLSPNYTTNLKDIIVVK
ncbi:MAG: Y-family DNA polymerase [Bacteroidales bacterium]